MMRTAVLKGFSRIDEQIIQESAYFCNTQLGDDLHIYTRRNVIFVGKNRK